MPLSVLLWGEQTCFRKAQPRLKELCDQGRFRIIGKTGWQMDEEKYGADLPRIPPEEISAGMCDLILPFDWKQHNAIVDFLLERPGITRENIVPGWLLADRSFDLERYRLLLKSRISILSNNCWGGVLCKTLGMENRSPTKNLWILDMDYLKLLREPEHYLLGTDPVFERWEKGASYDEERYPVLRLDDILLFCNHDTDPEEAIRKWMRRREKLDLDNLFVEYAAYNRDLEKSFLRLDRYPKKICLVNWKAEHPASVQVVQDFWKQHWFDSVVDSAYPFRCWSYYSPVELLLTGAHYDGPRLRAAYPLINRGLNKFPWMRRLTAWAEDREGVK